jgi:p21-activated kinase 1
MTPSSSDSHASVSRTVEYHRPSRNSAHYSSGTDMSLGMHPTSAGSSPRVAQGPSFGGAGAGAGAGAVAGDRHGPSSYRTAGTDPTSMVPSRAAPLPPGPSRRDSALASSTNTNAYPASSSRAGAFQSKSASNSPNPNRYSAGPTSAGYLSTSMAMTGSSNGAPPPRPSRAGTLPLGDQFGHLNGTTPTANSFRDPVPSARTVQGSPIAGQTYLPTPQAPPLVHQPFSAPGNPYAMSSVEKGMEETKIGLGVGTPMPVQESRDKELPKEPPTMGRNRSGTGKSSKDKKSVFGVLSGECVPHD